MLNALIILENKINRYFILKYDELNLYLYIAHFYMPLMLSGSHQQFCVEC